MNEDIFEEKCVCLIVFVMTGARWLWSCDGPI